MCCCIVGSLWTILIVKYIYFAQLAHKEYCTVIFLRRTCIEYVFALILWGKYIFTTYFKGCGKILPWEIYTQIPTAFLGWVRENCIPEIEYHQVRKCETTRAKLNNMYTHFLLYKTTKSLILLHYQIIGIWQKNWQVFMLNFEENRNILVTRTSNTSWIESELVFWSNYEWINKIETTG